MPWPSICLLTEGTAIDQVLINSVPPPNNLSTDNDPLYRFPQWQANLRVLEVTEIKTVPYVPLSHPFVERSFAWLNQFRRLRIRYEKRADIHEAFLALGCILICWKFLAGEDRQLRRSSLCR